MKKKLNQYTNTKKIQLLVTHFFDLFDYQEKCAYLPELCADEFDVITLFVLLHRENCCRLSVGLEGSIFISISKFGKSMMKISDKRKNYQFETILCRRFNVFTEFYHYQYVSLTNVSI